MQSTMHLLSQFTQEFVPDAKCGFLPTQDPLQTLPENYELHKKLNHLARNIPQLLAKKQLRAEIDALNQAFKEETLLLQCQKEKNIALLILTMLAQAYIWEDRLKPAKVIPKVIANNLEILCQPQKRFPILTYSDYVLNNWYRVNPELGITLDNIEPIITLTGTKDEKWFIKIHIAIEATCAPALHAIHQMYRAPEQAIEHLNTIATTLDEAGKILVRMKEQCDPSIFYNELRFLLNGWDNQLGIQFEGNLNAPRQYKGPSGAQSSILPALDEGLGIVHKQDAMFHHLLAFREYMPLPHQIFIKWLKANNEKFIASSTNYAALEKAIAAVKRFRFAHRYAMVGRFIEKPAAKQGVDLGTITGTGGTTPASVYLDNRLESTQAPMRRSRL